MSRRAERFAWLAGAGIGLAAEWVAFGWGDPRHWIPDLLAGWALIGCGLVASRRRPDTRSGALMAAAGFTWFLGNFDRSGIGAVDWAAAHAIYLHRGPLLHLVLAYPTGRPSSRLGGVAVGLGYVAAVATPVWRSDVATIALAVLLVAVVAHEYLRSVGRLRRARLLAVGASALLGVALIGGAVARLAVPRGDANAAALVGYQAVLCVMAAALLAGLVSASWGQAAVTDLVVELGEARSRTLRDELARALGDPTLEVGYWLPGSGAFVDATGRTVALPNRGATRSVTMVEREYQPVAVLIHDPAVLDDPGLLEAVSSAARLAASNARLQAEVQARVDEVLASRRRLLEAGDEARRRLERRLHDGAEHRLRQLEQALRATRRGASGEATRARIDEAEARLARSLEDVRRLANGLHPRALSELGLARALAVLAEELPVPVDVAVAVAGVDLPPAVEAATYFVCSEALANVAKYASANRVQIRITTGGGAVRIRIEDDGVGGADPDRGSGLHGLADRVETLGGTLRVQSPPGHGTRLAAEIPLDGEQR